VAFAVIVVVEACAFGVGVHHGHFDHAVLLVVI
jgi:hypothetical protein